MLALQLIISECPPLKEKDQQSGDIEDGDVEPVWRLAEHTVIGVKQHRDQDEPQQNLHQFDAPVVFLILKKQSLKQCKEKQGPKQQLHMLPGGFVNPGKGRNQDAAVCPIVQKVQDRTAKSNESKSCRLPKN